MAQFTTLIISSLNDMKDSNPEMSFGELLYTVFRKENLKDKPESASTGWLLELKDESVYNAIEKSIKQDTE